MVNKAVEGEVVEEDPSADSTQSHFKFPLLTSHIKDSNIEASTFEYRLL